MRITLLFVIFYACFIESSSSASSWIRQLVGSNCVKISRGSITEYYYCVDCVIENAIDCVNNMRRNKSSNVGVGCNMLSLMDSYHSSECCPRFQTIDTVTGRMDLVNIGSAYPEALRCIVNVGCSSTTVYTQLLAECESVCPSPTYTDPRDGGPICFADFNSARSSMPSLMPTVVMTILLSLYLSIVNIT